MFVFNLEKSLEDGGFEIHFLNDEYANFKGLTICVCLKMECLVLGGNLIGSSGAGHLCRCMHKVKRLQIGRCGLIGEDIEMMAEKMLLRNEPVRKCLLCFYLPSAKPQNTVCYFLK